MKKKIRPVTILAIGLIVVSMATVTAQRKKTMETTIIHPHINVHLNSYLGRTTKAKGRLAREIIHSHKKNMPQNRIQSLYLLPKGRIAFETHFALRVIDPSDKRIIDLPKDAGFPPILFPTGDLILRNKRDLNFYDRENLTLRSEASHTIDLGQKVPIFFRHREEYMTFSYSGPMGDSDTLFFQLKAQEKGSPLWTHRFSSGGDFPLFPPLTRDGEMVLCQKNSITIYEMGKRSKSFTPSSSIKKYEIQGKGHPIFVSIGEDNILYRIDSIQYGNRKRGYILTATSLEGKKLWQGTPMGNGGFEEYPTQPLAWGPGGMVYLINRSRIEAWQGGSCLWVFPLTKTPLTEGTTQFLTVLEGGSLLVVDHKKIHHLSPRGRIIWTYKEKGPLPFICRPMVTDTGEVVAATNEKLIFLR